MLTVIFSKPTLSKKSVNDWDVNNYIYPGHPSMKATDEYVQAVASRMSTAG